MEVLLDSESLGVLGETGELPVSGIGVVETASIRVTTRVPSTFSLYLLAPVGEGSFPGIDGQPDSDSGAETGVQDDPGTARRCGCAAGSSDPDGAVMIGTLGLITLCRRGRGASRQRPDGADGSAG